MLLFQRFLSKYLFGIPCTIFKANKNKEFDKNNIKKILIIKFWALGDSVVLLPAILNLKKTFPNAKIDVLSHKRNKVVFENQPFVDNTVEFGLFNIIKSLGRYDLCIDAEPALNVSAVIAFLCSRYIIGFSHGIRSRLYNKTVLFNNKQHMVQNYLDFVRKLGVTCNADKLIPLITTKKEKETVDMFLKTNKITKNNFVVGIVPGVAESIKYRMWPIEKTAQFCDELVKKHNAKIIFIDSKSNKSVVEKIISLMNEKSISAVDEFGTMDKVRLSAELINRCNIVISNDSGMMHVAAAQGAKTIGLFGPNTPNLWAPYGKGNISIAAKAKGCPYLDNTNPDLIPKKLTKEQITCMDKISIEEVLRAVERLK